MPGQLCPSLALPLGSICLWDDTKRNLPLMQLWTWKLSLMEGRGKSVGFSVLNIGFNSNANIILPKSDFNFSSSFPPLLGLSVKRASDLQSSHLNSNQHMLQGVNQGLCSSSLLHADSCSARLWHSTIQQPGSSLLPGTKALEEECWGDSLCYLCSILNLPHWGSQAY